MLSYNNETFWPTYQLTKSSQDIREDK